MKQRLPNGRTVGAGKPHRIVTVVDPAQLETAPTIRAMTPVGVVFNRAGVDSKLPNYFFYFYSPAPIWRVSLI